MVSALFWALVFSTSLTTTISPTRRARLSEKSGSSSLAANSEPGIVRTVGFLAVFLRRRDRVLQCRAFVRAAAATGAEQKCQSQNRDNPACFHVFLSSRALCFGNAPSAPGACPGLKPLRATAAPSCEYDAEAAAPAIYEKRLSHGSHSGAGALAAGATLYGLLRLLQKNCGAATTSLSHFAARLA